MEIFKHKNIKDLIKRFGLRATAKLELPNAKEQPGFDIEIEEVIGKNGIASNLLRPRWKIPQETQDIFIKSCESSHSLKVHSEWLLDVYESKSPLRIIRNYHSPYFSLRGNEYRFPSLGDVMINSKFILLGRFGEGPDDFSALNSYFAAESLNQTNCWARINGRELRIDFDGNGAISRVFIGDKEGNFSSIWEGDIELLRQKGTLSLKGTQNDMTKHVSTDHILLILEDKTIILERFKKDDLENSIDKVVMPMQIDRKGILSKLFDPRTLKDPINAPPELDRWVLMNFFEVCGITWGQKPEGNKRRKI